MLHVFNSCQLLPPLKAEPLLFLALSNNRIFAFYDLQDVRTKKKLSSSGLRLRQKKALHTTFYNMTL